ncbi:hypothetical protein [Biformimicrobium ophioploci]|uniref:GIY-YIG domain-containing protein n=1 Tax=Biformimicrobium ophioploci TaxID=3036711 RepID=A0ABQ6M340_9GAMM|nr:hypothetical protein [Microbulbifer sp. NKW57]GMG88766.1 hypothetical protein MNKW57_30870 [Microbulbifer sp. NKW57]
MPNKEELIKYTAEFFERHWPRDLELSPPVWDIGWSWSGSVPHHDKGGVYALFSANGDVLYVGLGISSGGGPYDQHGISRRLIAHVIATDKSKGRGHYVPQDKWQDVKDLGAVGFPAEYSYLAAALEDFLIRKLAPSRNAVKKRGVVA